MVVLHAIGSLADTGGGYPRSKGPASFLLRLAPHCIPLQRIFPLPSRSARETQAKERLLLCSSNLA
jgi:hypothetical protein